MASPRVKTISAGEIGLFMLEQGKILTADEYRASSPVPIRWATMKRMYGNWNRCLRYMKQQQPDIWKDLEALSDPKPVKPVFKKMVEMENDD